MQIDIPLVDKLDCKYLSRETKPFCAVRLVWGSCGFPGNSHDAVIFRSTDLWTRIQEGVIPVIGKTVGNVTVPPPIVGDSAFPLRTCLMKSYTNAVLTPQQRNFFFFFIKKAT